VSLLKRKEPLPRLESPAQRERKAELVEPIRRTWARVDVSRLTVEEAAELRELWTKARDATDEGLYRDDLSALSEKERKRVHALIDQALPPHEVERQRALRDERERRALQAFADEQVSRGVPPVRRLGLLPGEVALAPETFTLGALHLADVGLLAAILHAWSGGVVPFRDSHWSDDGASLVCPKRLELLDRELNQTYGRDGLPTSVVDIRATLSHLARNSFLEVERDPAGWTVRLGPRLRGYVEGVA